MITLGMMCRIAWGHTGRDIYDPPPMLYPMFSVPGGNSQGCISAASSTTLYDLDSIVSSPMGNCLCNFIVYLHSCSYKSTGRW